MSLQNRARSSIKILLLKLPKRLLYNIIIEYGIKCWVFKRVYVFLHSRAKLDKPPMFGHAGFFQGSPVVYHREDFVKAKAPYLTRLTRSSG